MHKYIWLLLAILILSIGLILLSGKTTKPETTTTPDKSEAVQDSNFNAVVALNQPAGNSTTVSQVLLTSPGYVVIRAEENRKPGAVLGHSLKLPAATHEQVSISLSRATQEGEPLFAILHTDNGDGVFEFPGPDIPLTDNAGNVVMMMYIVGDLNHGESMPAEHIE